MADLLESSRSFELGLPNDGLLAQQCDLVTVRVRMTVRAKARVRVAELGSEGAFGLPTRQ